MGVSLSSPWDLEMADNGYEVLEFDASIERSPYPNHPNIKFFKKFVGIIENENTISLERIIVESHLNPNAHNILQCDVENAEWEILERIDMNLLKDNFSQIIFEFHRLYPDDNEGCKLRFKILEKIHQYFVPIWTHYNNRNEMLLGEIDGHIIPFCPFVEISYVRKDLLPPQLEKIQGAANLTNMPNNPIRPDIPAIFP